MRWSLVVTRPAAQDLAKARRWSGQPGAGVRATMRFQRIVEAVNELKMGPLVWPEGEHRDIRERPIEGYRIVYTVETSRGDKPGRVRVLRVFGPGQDRSGL